MNRIINGLEDTHKGGGCFDDLNELNYHDDTKEANIESEYKFNDDNEK